MSVFMKLLFKKNRISILCLDENIYKGNPLVYVDFLFRCHIFGVAGLYFPWNVRRADLDAL